MNTSNAHTHMKRQNIMINIFKRNTITQNVETSISVERANTRMELLRLLYVDGTLGAAVGTPAFDVAIDLERRGFCDVRVGHEIYGPQITISPRGVAFVEEVLNMFQDDAFDVATA